MRDRRGNIVALGHPGASWSPRRVADVVQDIRLNRRSYYVEESGHRTYVRLFPGRVLRTTAEATDANNLASLPVL